MRHKIKNRETQKMINYANNVFYGKMFLTINHLVIYGIIYW